MPPDLTYHVSSGGQLVLFLTGEWTLENRLPSADWVKRQIQSATDVQQVAFDTSGLADWDSGLVAFVVRFMKICIREGIPTETDGLPIGVQRLILLYSAMPVRRDARKKVIPSSFFEDMGNKAAAWWDSLVLTLDFIGGAAIAMTRLLLGKAQFRRSDLFIIMQQCGAEALPIVSLISVLVGLILAFVSSLQLKIFGAQIYVASLVGIGMVRALAPVMTGVIMAGRTGAAFAAQLGTMEVNEEIDALRTFAISPVEFLVLPRMLALFLMMPLLALYADLLGVVGGLIIGVYVLNLDFFEYYNKTREAVTLNDFWVGLFSASVFGVLVAVAGCLRGMQCRRSALAVGEAATSAVVTGIVCIVVAMAIITIICDVLNI